MYNCKYFEICGLSGDNDGLCILHANKPGKSKKPFNEQLGLHRETKGDDFSLMVFPENFDFPKTPFDGDVNFTKASFSGDIDFSEAIFDGKADFGGTKFSGEVLFSNAHFKKGANFLESKFDKGANFSDSLFSEMTDFTEAHFEGKVDFRGVKFSGVNFNYSTFTNWANFIESKFLDQANFIGAKFVDVAVFHGANFNTKVDFSQVTFSKVCNFSGATFAGKADFSQATFKEEPIFVSAIFKKESIFYHAMFFAGANFDATTFEERVDFRLSVFGGASFEETLFKGKKVDFRFSSFQGRTLFKGKEENFPVFLGVDEVNFQRVIIDPPEALTLLDADLQKCKFLDTDLRKAQFIGVIWPKIYGKRYGVYDEIALLEGSWSRVEELYRQLKQNYEDRRNFERAGNFHYGEKEMRRRNPETPLGLRFLLNLYRWVSGYGEKCLPPLYWMGGLIVAITFGYLALGIRLKEINQILTFTINDWLRTLLYSFEVMFLLKPDALIPLGLWANFLKALETILGPIFIGLFALAVRQKLKR
jgi:uncharacterized protein YjbI with pentapeptide repeats